MRRREVLGEYRALVETMRDGKFGKYQEDEQKEVEKLMQKLEGLTF